MKQKIQLLDCTLRDGAYIVNSKFGTPAIKGIMSKMRDAGVEIIECGWLKNPKHQEGSTYFNIPSDIEPYIGEKGEKQTYVAMIDWDRYDLDQLPPYDGKTIDAIRVVFPRGKFKEGIKLCEPIKAKGYDVYLQASNTLAYSDEDLAELAEEVNKAKPVAISIVDTFGAMYSEDLTRIFTLLDEKVDKDIKIGFHSHNNQQLSFALSMQFVEMTEKSGRAAIVDASLCGMGRGAGNATTELIANYLNRKHSCNYDMNVIMDAIDNYMGYFEQNYKWGYSTPYFIAGMYCCHVNNIAYLLDNHRTSARDMRNIIESMSAGDRLKYDYDLLESKYVENQSRIVDDALTIEKLKQAFDGRKILLIAPGKTVSTEKDRVQKYIDENKPIVIGVNSIVPSYSYDYLFFVNPARYSYAKEVHTKQFNKISKIVLSNVKTEAQKDEYVVNFNKVVKRGWEHFDNSVISALRLFEKLSARDVAIAGFDGFKDKYDESYADAKLPSVAENVKWKDLNDEISDMFNDILQTKDDSMKIEFVTDSIYEKVGK